MNKFSLGMITTCTTLLLGSLLLPSKKPYTSFIYTTVYAYEPRGEVVYQRETSLDTDVSILTPLTTPLDTLSLTETSEVSSLSQTSDDQVSIDETVTPDTQDVKQTLSTHKEDTKGYFSIGEELFPLMQMGDPTLYGGQLMEANQYVYDFNGGGYHHLGLERMTRQGQLMLQANVGDVVYYDGTPYKIHHIDYQVSNKGPELANLAYQYHQEGALTASTCESTEWMSPQRLFYLLPL